MDKEVVLYYFTGTGNSLRIAQTIRNGFQQKGIKVTMLDIADEKTPLLNLDNVLIGFCYPVYGFGMPRIVRRFIEKMPVSRGIGTFLAATNGGEIGKAVTQGWKILEKKGYEIIDSESIEMPSNYVVGHIAEEGECRKQIKEGEAAAEKFVERLISGGTKNIAKTKGIPGLLMSVANLGFTPFLPYMTKKFYADENCSSCGYCASICPTKSLILQEGKLRWLDTCEQCFRCINYCPQEAIQTYGKTKGKKRYKLLPFEEGGR